MARAQFAKLFFPSLLILCNSVLGQVSQRTEIGGGLGIFNYTGDIINTYDLSTARPAATFFYRTNISRVISFRTSVTAGQLATNDSNNPMDAFAAKRNASFDLFLLELSGCFEYHFLDWRDDKRRLRFTPYLFAGAALFGFSGDSQNKTAEYSTVQMSIPFGGGMKYVLNPRY